jgi:hypothetical protein
MVDHTDSSALHPTEGLRTMNESEMVTLRITMPSVALEDLEARCRRDGIPLDQLLAGALWRAALGLRCDVLRCVTNVGR